MATAKTLVSAPKPEALAGRPNCTGTGHVKAGVPHLGAGARGHPCGAMWLSRSSGFLVVQQPQGHRALLGISGLQGPSSPGATLAQRGGQTLHPSDSNADGFAARFLKLPQLFSSLSFWLFPTHS